MPRSISDFPPRLTARIAGFLYLLIFLSAPSGASSATPVKMVINLLADVGVAFLLFYLLRPVSTRLSFYAALFRCLFVAVMAITSLTYFGAMTFLQGAHSSAYFNEGYSIALIPFGIHCNLVGYLICKSIFLPRILGVLMIVAGLGYLFFIWPSLGNRLFFPYIVVPAVVGEGALTLWLLVMGVSAQRWREQRSVTSGGGSEDRR